MWNQLSNTMTMNFSADVYNISMAAMWSEATSPSPWMLNTTTGGSGKLLTAVNTSANMSHADVTATTSTTRDVLENTSDTCKIALGVFATCLYMPTMIFLWAVYRSKGRCCALSVDDFYGVIEVGEEGWFMRRLICYKKRPMILEVIHLVCKVVLLMAFWTDMSLITPALAYVFFDLCVVIYIINLYRKGEAFTTDNLEFTWMFVYTVFGGFPVGTATKIVLAMWLDGTIDLWVVPMPFMLFACLAAVFTPIFAIVRALLVLLSSARRQGDTRRIMTSGAVLVSSPLLCAWCYSFFVLENYIDPHFLLPVPTPTNCTCLALSPFLVVLLVFLIAMSFSSAYAKSCQYFPELFTSWCIAFAAFDMLYVLDTSTGRNILVMPPVVLFMNILVHVVYDTILYVRIGQMSRSLPVQAVQEAHTQATRSHNGRNSKNQTKRRPAIFRCLDLASLEQLQVSIKLDVCSICCDDYTGDEPSGVLIGLLKRCGHAFHFDCVWRWIDERRSCPLCRDTVAVSEDGMILLTLHDIKEALAMPGDESDGEAETSVDADVHTSNRAKPQLKDTGEVNEAFENDIDGEIDLGNSLSTLDNQPIRSTVPMIFHIS